MRGMCVFLAFLALQIGPAAADWYGARHARPPAGNRVYVCHGYSCRIVTPVQLSDDDVARIAAPLRRPAADAASERKALAKAVAAFETIVGARTGTSGDLPGMQFGGGRDGQLDCIDEATNTTSLLRLLAARGAIRFHSVGEPSARGFFLDGRYPHATAVIAEKQGGTRWAIDSWPDANGRPPVLQPLAQWMRERHTAPPA